MFSPSPPHCGPSRAHTALGFATPAAAREGKASGMDRGMAPYPDRKLPPSKALSAEAGMALGMHPKDSRLSPWVATIRVAREGGTLTGAALPTVGAAVAEGVGAGERVPTFTLRVATSVTQVCVGEGVVERVRPAPPPPPPPPTPPMLPVPVKEREAVGVD